MIDMLPIEDVIITGGEGSRAVRAAILSILALAGAPVTGLSIAIHRLIDPRAAA